MRGKERCASGGSCAVASHQLESHKITEYSNLKFLTTDRFTNMLTKFVSVLPFAIAGCSDQMPSTPVSSNVDTFDGDGPLLQFSSNNTEALPEVQRYQGRYHATLRTNAGERTLHFHEHQGRLDAKRLKFPFEFVARNIGIGTLEDSQVPPDPQDFPNPMRVFMFAGIQVHSLDFQSLDSAHFVVGHRGKHTFTVEGKNTRDGRSKVNDAGDRVVPNGRADLRVVGTPRKKLKWYWQQPNMEPGKKEDNWIAYREEGTFPGRQAKFADEVYVGLITYSFEQKSVPFVGTSDSIEWVQY